MEQLAFFTLYIMEVSISMSIEIQNLSKKYLNSKRKSLDNVNMTINNGILGLIGENGAGKTTLLKILSTQIPPSEGSVKVFGYDPVTEIESVRSIMGYLPQHVAFFPNLTSFEMMDYIGLLKNMNNEKKRKEEIEYWLEKFNLSDKRNEKIKSLSGGMKQRLGIVQSLLGDPKVVILDEPTVGLDPNERLRFRNIISDISKDKVVIISTHIINDIAMMGNQLAIIKKGNLLYSGYTDHMLEQVNEKVFTEVIDHTAAIDFSKYGEVISYVRKKDGLEVRFISEDKKGHYIAVEPTLEDAYFYVNRFGKEGLGCGEK